MHDHEPSVRPPSLDEPDAVRPRRVVVGVAGAGDDAVGGGGGAAADGPHRHPEAAPRHRSVGLEGDGGVVAGGGEHCPAVPRNKRLTFSAVQMLFLEAWSPFDSASFMQPRKKEICESEYFVEGDEN